MWQKECLRVLILNTGLLRALTYLSNKPQKKNSFKALPSKVCWCLYFGKGNTKVVLPGGAADDTPYLCNCTSEHSPQSKCDLIWHNSIAPYFKCRTQMKTSNCPVCEQKENRGNHLMQVTHSISFNIALREYFVSFMSNFEFQNLQNDGIEIQKKVFGKKRL